MSSLTLLSFTVVTLLEVSNSAASKGSQPRKFRGSAFPQLVRGEEVDRAVWGTIFEVDTGGHCFSPPG
jgi:hypothetical protein